MGHGEGRFQRNDGRLRWQTAPLVDGMLVESAGLGQGREAIGVERTCSLGDGHFRAEGVESRMDWLR